MLLILGSRCFSCGGWFHNDSTALLGVFRGSSVQYFGLSLRLIGVARRREQEIGQSIHVRERTGIAHLTQHHHAALAPPRHGPGDVQLRGQNRSSGQYEARQFRKLLRHDINPFFQHGHVRGIQTTTDSILSCVVPFAGFGHV